MDERDIERLFDKKFEDVNYKQQIQQIKAELIDTTAKAEQLKKELSETRYFIENAEPCPECGKLVLPTSRECRNCHVEFEHKHKD